MIKCLALRIIRIAAFLAVGCGFLVQANAVSADDKVLVIGRPADPDNVDLHVTTSGVAYSVTCSSYETLVKTETDRSSTLTSTRLAPGLASSWTVDNAGTTWTFKITLGHKFSDGTPVTTQAIAANFARMLKIGKGPIGSFPTLSKVEATNDTTVTFTLTAPFAPFLAALSSCPGGILNPAIMKHEVNGDLGQAYLADKTMGSGPFQITSWEKGQQITLEQNPYYVGPKPKLDKIVFKIIREASARRLQLDRGDLDIVEEIPPDQIQAMKGAPGITVVDQPSAYINYLYLNNKRPTLDQVKVRQAISYAIDYDAIIKGILQGSGKRLNGIMPSGMPGYDPQALQYSYDPAKAKALLAEAGVAANTKLGFLYTKSDPNWEPIALAVQQYLGAIGIKVELENAALAPMREKIGKGDFDISIGFWGPDFADPSQFLNWILDSKYSGLPGDRAFYKNDEVDAKLREAQVELKPDQRARLYREVQNQAMRDAPYVMLFQKNYQLAMRSDVKGYLVNPVTGRLYNFPDMSKGK